MSLSNTAETALLQHYFNNSAVPDIGDVGGLQPSSTAGNLYVALHTADPGEGGNQSTSEASYTGYARVAVARNSGGWTISGNTVSNTALVQFGLCTAGSSVVTHFSIGTASSGAGSVLLSGALTSTLSINVGIQPQFSAGQLAPTVD